MLSVMSVKLIGKLLAMTSDRLGGISRDVLVQALYDFTKSCGTAGLEKTLAAIGVNSVVSALPVVAAVGLVGGVAVFGAIRDKCSADDAADKLRAVHARTKGLPEFLVEAGRVLRPRARPALDDDREIVAGVNAFFAGRVAEFVQRNPDAAADVIEAAEFAKLSDDDLWELARRESFNLPDELLRQADAVDRIWGDLQKLRAEQRAAGEVVLDKLHAVLVGLGRDPAAVGEHLHAFGDRPPSLPSMLRGLASGVGELQGALGLTRDELKLVVGELQLLQLAARNDVAALRPKLDAIYDAVAPHPTLELPESTWDPAQPRGNPFVFSDRRVPLFGRDRELDELITDFLWRDSHKPVMWRLYHGEAATGKSRLALDFCEHARSFGWDAGFLPRAPAFDRWAEWCPARDTLVVIDYAGERPEAALAAIAGVRNDHVGGKRVRFLLLERSADGAWNDRLRRNDTLLRREHPASSVQLRPIGATPLGSTPPAAAELPQWRMMRAVFAERGVDPPDADRCMDILGEIDDAPATFSPTAYGYSWTPRPLYAAILADAICDLGIERVDAWSGDELLDYVLRRELTHWEKLACPATHHKMAERHLNALVVGTVMGGLKLPVEDDAAAPLVEVRAAKLLPDNADGDRFLLECLAAFAWPTQAVKDAPNATPDMPPLQPDLLGERFVLDRLHGALVLNDGDGPTVAKRTAQLVSACWRAKPRETADFAVRATRDFPHHPATDFLLDTCGDAPYAADHRANAIEEIFPFLLGRNRVERAQELFDELRRANAAEPADARFAGPFAGTLGVLGSYWHMRAGYKEALGYFRSAFEIVRVACGDDHQDVAVYGNNIGAVLHSQGKLSDALDAFRKAERIDRATLGARHPNVATCINNIGAVLRARGDLPGALSAYREAERIMRASFEDYAPSVAVCTNNVGCVLMDMQNFAGALVAYREAERITRAALGDAHPHIAAVVSNVGTALEAQGKLEEALTVYRESEQIARATFGNNHPQVAICVNNVGGILLKREDYAGAVSAFREAEAVDRASFGDSHPNVAARVNNIGAVLKSQGDVDAAREAYVASFDALLSALGPQGPLVVTAAFNLIAVEVDPVSMARLAAGDEAADALRLSMLDKLARIEQLHRPSAAGHGAP